VGTEYGVPLSVLASGTPVLASVTPDDLLHFLTSVPTCRSEVRVSAKQLICVAQEGEQEEHRLRRSFNFVIPYRTGIVADSERLSPLFIKTDCILRIVRLRGADLDRVPKVLHEGWHDAIQLANAVCCARYSLTNQHVH
jgi:hypothetical protein